MFDIVMSNRLFSETVGAFYYELVILLCTDSDDQLFSSLAQNNQARAWFENVYYAT